MSVFQDFARISNLQLNLGKTVLIPLWESSESCIRRWLQDDFPNWAGVEIAWTARYLGFFIGPARIDMSWKQALSKFHARVSAWSSLRLGMNLNSRVYKTFCCSVLSFLWQLEEPPPEVLEAEAWALRRMAPGPGNWVRPLELHHLKQGFGLPFEFPSFCNMARAAKLRILEFEPQMNCQQYSDDLLSARASACFKHEIWSRWYDNSHVSVLLSTRLKLQDVGVTPSTVRSALLQARRPGSSISALRNYVKNHFQSTVLHQLVLSEAFSHEHAIRLHLVRWKLTSVPEGVLARRAARHLRAACGLVPVRVAIVLFRTWFNGWCTRRRFQIRCSECLLGCGTVPGAGYAHECLDSIEHYAVCPVVTQFATQRLHLASTLVKNLLSFLCLNAGVDDETRAIQMLLLFSIYSATNYIRFAAAPKSFDSIQELLLQYVHQGAGQLSFSQNVVHKRLTARWAMRRRVQDP